MQLFGFLTVDDLNVFKLLIESVESEPKGRSGNSVGIVPR